MNSDEKQKLLQEFEEVDTWNSILESTGTFNENAILVVQGLSAFKALLRPILIALLDPPKDPERKL